MTVRGVLAATAETEHVARGRAQRAAAGAGAAAHGGGGRARRRRRRSAVPGAPGRRAGSCTDLGPAPDAAEVAARLRAVSDVLLAAPRLPVVVAAAVVHAELATVRPFVRGNAVVARALDRALVQAGGLDPTGVAVTEAGHGARVALRPTSGRWPPTAAVTSRAWGCGSPTAAPLSAPRLPRARGSRMPCSPDGSTG